MSAKQTVEARLASLEQRVRTLEGGRPGRKALPILVSEEGVCGIDPDSDSTICPHASLYRHQKGCRGTRCAEITAEYYRDYRAARRDGDGE
jgi:hypothetical protein